MASLKKGDHDSDLHTTQGLTKFLRGKNTSLDSIYKISIGLIFDKSEYVLPKKEKFIFELLCDRLSQERFKDFRTCSKMWDLFKKLWIKSESESTTKNVRNQVLRRSNMASSVCNALDEIKSKGTFKDDNELVSNISDCVHLLNNCQKVTFSQEQSIVIMDNLLFFASAALDYDSKLLQNIAISVCLIYERCNFHAIKFSKRSVTRFCSSCLPNVILLLTNPLLDSQSLRTRLEAVVFDTLFSERSIGSCKDNLGFFINNARAQNKMTLEGLKYIFELSVHKLGVSDSEEVFKAFVSRYPSFSSSLIPLLVYSKNSLSTKFLSSLVKESLGKTDLDTLDIIKCILSRNSEVGVKFGRSIMSTLSREKLSETTLSVAKALFQCYANSRDLATFVTLWEKILPGSRDLPSECVWTSREFSMSCSRDFASLPYSQLEQILKTLAYDIKDDPTKSFLPLISICNGMLLGVTGSSGHHKNATLISSLDMLSGFFSKLIKETFKLKSEPRIWELYSYIFMLYELSTLAENVDIKAIFKCRHDQKNNMFFYVTIFRIIEQNPDRFTHKISSSFVKFFESSSFSRSAKLSFFMRWVVLINALFRKTDISKLVKVLFDKKDCDLQELDHLLSDPVLDEQHTIIVSIIECLIKGDYMLEASYLNLIGKIPVFCFEKYQRKQMIDKLILSSSITSESEDIIFRLLELPTSKSILETEPEYILKLISIRKPNVIESKSFEIAVGIFTENLRMGNDSFFEKCESLFKRQILELRGNIFVSYVVLAMITSEKQISSGKPLRFDDLASLCISHIVDTLSEENLNLTNDDICTLCNVLVKFSKLNLIENDVNLKRMILNLGSDKGKHSDNVNESLFQLLCSLGVGCYDPIFVFSLFTILPPSEKNTYSLNMYIASLSSNEQMFIEEWGRVLQTYMLRKKDGISFFDGLALLSRFMENMKKPTDEKALQNIRSLVLRSLSFAQVLNDSLLGKKYENILDFLKILCLTITEKSWSLTQYSIELIFVFISKVCDISLAETNLQEDLTTTYVQLMQVVSSVLLYQRFRLSGRSHVLIFTLVQFMEQLFTRYGFNDTVSSSEKCAMSFERLIENYCEPSTTILTERSGDSETTTGISTTASTQISKIRIELRKSLPVFIMHYLQYFLRYRTSTAVREPLSRSIFLAFKRLTENELNYINASLDSQCRPAFKKIYDEYLKFGKWREE